MTCFVRNIISEFTGDSGREADGMHGMDFQREMARERTKSYAVEAEERRIANLLRKGRPSLRARAARHLFDLAFRLERNATWSAVWERMEAPKRS